VGTTFVLLSAAVIVAVDVVWHARRRYPSSPHPVLDWWNVEREGRRPTKREAALAKRIATAHAEGRVVPVSVTGRHTLVFTMSDGTHRYYYCGNRRAYREALASRLREGVSIFPGSPPRDLWRAHRRAVPVRH
jgi:hypothetical protein